ncbi:MULTISPECIES: glutamate--cysteine ligase [unclassified Curtobacterium]|jgi:carboxylate-amine ligase|uniref:glutamate--cysteine ligase n=1 Tax=unclassified Curtobacterium TaxID=257496 RepID=UPI0008EFC9E6|nr:MULTISPECIES: glutamate--cysteine ligase [unclassified Curtobacterium]MDR6172032.1 carboxylate-amine ligase [Curtobacterium sp. SORGH_AS_0776]SFF72238.1 carboxylate-amine ligase [Curtobacterium sp. YR515]
MYSMDIRFTESRPSTIGVEWELPLVDRDTGDLTPRAPAVIQAVQQRLGDHDRVTEELLTNTVEVVTGVHSRVSGATSELSGIIGEVVDAAEPLDAQVMCAGTHPFAVWDQQEITPDSEHYTTLIDRTRWWGRQMLIWGVHVHVGIDDRDKALPILGAMLAYVPHLQAFTASSPFWAGTDTGYASNRALMFQQLPTGGLPPALGAWANFEEVVDDLTRTGVIEGVKDLRWDIRPSPGWGTLENRVSDGISTLHEVGAVTALVQCLVTEMSDRLDAGETLPTMQPWFVRENKWRAARYGMEAEIITNAAGDERLVTDEVHDLVQRLDPVADRLGCQQELHHLDTMIADGASYQRQLQVAQENGGDLRAVVRHLVTELRDSL